jgi:hypothetical protein
MQMNSTAPVLNNASDEALPVANRVLASVAETNTSSTESPTGKAVQSPIPPAPSTYSGPLRSRRISPQAGRALEILGHAIDYLIDEWVHAEGEILSPHDPRAEAIHLLTQLNREIYDSCPPAFTIMERLESTLLRLLGFKTKVESPKQSQEDHSSPIYPNHS